MTDSMKFGPEWLRNMATDVTNNQGTGGASSSTSSASSTNSNNNGSSSSYQFGHHVQQLPVRGLFPEFRYGREEMLSLFNKNSAVPEILPSFKKLFIDKVQYPLALTPSTEEEVFQSVPQQPTQRPQWLQRSPVAFNSAPRGNGRGGSVDRGRVRGKAMYHPIFPRPTPMFEDDARNLKSERSWSERNGGVAGENSTVGGVPDWSISPSSSPRKDFTGHPGRNLENWRRSRHDEDGVATSGPSGSGNPNSLSGGSCVSIVSSGGPGADGWRGSATNNFGNNRWGRSTSWRDDDSGNGCVEPNAYIIPAMQRSYSTIATSERTYFSGLSKSSSSTSATGGSGVGIGSSGGDGANKTTVNNRNYHSNATSHQWETEDVLPEWAMENPTDTGGTFDATGAFHGSVEEDDEKLRSGGSGSSSTTSSTSSSNKKSNNDMTKQQQDGNNRCGNRKTITKDNEMGQIEPDALSLNDEDSETNDIEQRPFKDENLQNNVSVNESRINHSIEKTAFSNKLENSDEHSSLETPSMSSSSPPQLAAQTTSTSTPSSANTSSLMHLSSQKMPLTELSDRMQEVADDMVEKLIMDDDNVSHDNQKSSAAETTVAHSASVVTVKLPPNNNQTSNRLVSNAAKVAALFKNQTLVNKPMFLPAVDSIMQQHHLQQVAGVPPPGTRMLPPPITKPNNELWYYRDPQSKIQGPFTAMEMNEWYRAGYFDENLYVRRVCDSRFAALGDLIKICGQMPFQSSHLIPPLLSTEVPSLTNPIPIMALPTHDPGHPMKEVPGVVLVNGPNMGVGGGDLKGSVTATADALIAAVKNTMCPSDMSHMLNAHFQILQEQYIRHQEMMVVAEFSTKDTFNRLPPSEKAALVRQKVHMIGLPEHLTNLTSLSNALATHNPAAGNQLSEVISEYTKKFSYGISPNEAQFYLQQHVHHQQQQQQVQQVQQQSQNPFIDPDDYLQQQQQTNQQSGGMFQNVSYRSPFTQIEGNVSNASGEEQLNADMLNEMNLRMMLNQGRLRPGREQAQIPTQLGSAPNDFGAELLARGGPQVLAAAVNMIPQWPPHILPQIQHQPPQQLQPQQQQNTQAPQVVANQWPIIPGPVPVSQLHAALSKPPALMWPATDAGAAQMIMQQQQSLQLSQSQHVEVMHPKVENNFASVPIQQQQLTQPQAPHRHQDSNSNNVGNAKDELSVEENANAINNNVSNTTIGNMPAPSGVALGPITYATDANTKNKNEKLKHNDDSQNSIHITTKQQPTTSVNAINSSSNNNKRNGKQKSSEKAIDSMSKNRQQSQQQAVPVAGPTEEERRKEAAEDKRKQKEEKKRQQQEDEKKRLQLIEEEKRRQASEEKERQKEIHAHRRKAMLASNSGCSSIGLGSNSNLPSNGKSTTSGPSSSAMTKQERMHISVAPWSTNAQATIASTPGPSLAEIQKAERKERRADQQRHMELMEKQMRIAAEAEASDNVLKWNAAPIAVKSLAEIQAEEAKRLASEQAANAELQRRKEQDQAASAAANNLSPSNPFALIWSGSKVWGASNNTSGFWEEPVKFSSAAASISALTSASVIAKTMAQTSLASNTYTTSKQIANTTSVYGGNTLSSSATASAGSANRNLNKSQTVSNMSSSNWTSVTTSNNISQAKSYQQNSSAAKQQGNKDKKGNKNIAGSSSSTNCSSSNAAVPSVSVATNHLNKNDEYRNEYTGWCTRSLNNMNPKVDVPTFVTFLQDLESPYEVKDYIRMYLGESKEYTEFAKQFLERRSKYRNLQRAQNAHIDDMCKPAPAINPSGNDSFDNKGKQKKVKKSKMTKLDARILGFSVTAAEGRINVGDRDYVDAS